MHISLDAWDSVVQYTGPTLRSFHRLPCGENGRQKPENRTEAVICNARFSIKQKHIRQSRPTRKQTADWYQAPPASKAENLSTPQSHPSRQQGTRELK